MSDNYTFIPANDSHVNLVPLEQSTQISAMGGFVQAAQSNPAAAYLISLSSQKSRVTMASLLDIVAVTMGYKNLKVCDWSQLTYVHLQALKELHYQAQKAPATTNTYISALKGVAQQAWMMKLISTDDFQHIKLVKSVRGTRLAKGRALTGKEIAALYQVCDEPADVAGKRDAAILAILLGCGLRRSEVVALDVSDVGHKEQSLKVLGKGNKERLAYLQDWAYERVDSWLEQRGYPEHGPLFTRIRRHGFFTHDRLTDQAVYHILNERRLAAGVEKFAPHDLRRTFATTLLDNGEDLFTVQELMNHSDVSTTKKYDRRGDERLKSAAAKLRYD